MGSAQNDTPPGAHRALSDGTPVRSNVRGFVAYSAVLIAGSAAFGAWMTTMQKGQENLGTAQVELREEISDLRAECRQEFESLRGDVREVQRAVGARVSAHPLHREISP